MTISFSRGLAPSVILAVVMAPEIDVVCKVGNQMLRTKFSGGWHRQAKCALQTPDFQIGLFPKYIWSQVSRSFHREKQ